MTPAPMTETATGEPTVTPAPSVTPMLFFTPTQEIGTLMPTPFPFTYGIVIATKLNWRVDPDIEAGFMGPPLSKDEIVFISEISEDTLWYGLERGGWVFAAYVELEM